MRFGIICACIVSLSVQIEASRYALLIGRNDGGESVEILKYAQKDAQQLADLLRESGGFRPDDIEVLISPDSTQIADALKRMRALTAGSANDNDNLFLLYYSGHADAGGLLLGKERFAFDKIYETFSKITAGVRIGIFDACYSGVVTAFKGGAGAEPLFFERPRSVKGQVIIASSAAYERAQESSSLKSSVFTFHLCNGLRGSADISGDKKITLNEAYQYAYRKTIETSALTSGEIQHPVYKFNIQGQGDIILTSFTDKSAGLLFDKNSVGKYLILSESYLDVFADFYKEKGREHFIVLNTGKYTVIRAFENEVGTYSLTLNRTKTRKIRDNMFSPDFLTESRIKGPSSDEVHYPVNSSVQTLPNASVSAGTGISFNFVNNSRPDRNLFLEITGKWLLNQYFDFSLDITGFPASKDIAVVPNLLFIPDRYRNVQFVAGAGAGLMYDHKSGSANDAFPLITVQNGIAMPLGRSSTFSLMVPFTVGFGDKTTFRSGFKFNFVVYGKK
ncbi:MAG: caspase family protein [Chitinispirillaceae bacterium]|nr:caspase family protein [Chitinispirillaceae bacterium]